MATKQELADAKIITLGHLPIIKEYIDNKAGDTYEAGDNITFESDTETGKTKINANVTEAIDDKIGDIGEGETVKEYIDKNKTTIINCVFDVDENGNLIVITPEGEEAPDGFSIDENGYLIYKE